MIPVVFSTFSILFLSCIEFQLWYNTCPQDAVDLAIEKQQEKLGEGSSSSSSSSSSSDSESEKFGLGNAAAKARPKRKAAAKPRAKAPKEEADGEAASVGPGSVATGSLGMEPTGIATPSSAKAEKQEKQGATLLEKGSALLESLNQIGIATLWGQSGKIKAAEGRITAAIDLNTRLENKDDVTFSSLATSLSEAVERVHKDLEFVQAIGNQQDDWTQFLETESERFLNVFAEFKKDEFLTFLTDICKKLVEDQGL